MKIRLYASLLVILTACSAFAAKRPGSGVEGVLLRSGSQEGGMAFTPLPAVPTSGKVWVVRVNKSGRDIGDPLTRLAVDPTGRYSIPMSPGHYVLEGTLVGTRWTGYDVGGRS